MRELISMLNGSAEWQDYLDYGIYFLLGVGLCFCAYWLGARWPRLTKLLIWMAILTPILSFPFFYTLAALPVFAQEILDLGVLVKLGLFSLGILLAGKFARWRLEKADTARIKAEAILAEKEWVDQLKAEQLRREELQSETTPFKPVVPIAAQQE